MDKDTLEPYYALTLTIDTSFIHCSMMFKYTYTHVPLDTRNVHDLYIQSMWVHVCMYNIMFMISVFSVHLALSPGHSQLFSEAVKRLGEPGDERGDVQCI